MMKIIDYTILMADSRHKLIDLVKELLPGWQPVDRAVPFVSRDRKSTWWTQTMVKYEERTVSVRPPMVGQLVDAIPAEYPS
jgi:hypothetical protein